jgi:hypothetical protein
VVLEISWSVLLSRAMMEPRNMSRLERRPYLCLFERVRFRIDQRGVGVRLRNQLVPWVWWLGSIYAIRGKGHTPPASIDIECIAIAKSADEEAYRGTEGWTTIVVQVGREHESNSDA